MEKVSFEVSWGSLWRVFFFVLAVAVMFLGRQILLGLFLALVISSGLEFIVTYLERRRLPRALGVIFTFVTGVGVFIGIIYAIVPLLIADIYGAVASLDATVRELGLGPIAGSEVIAALNNIITRISASLFLGETSSPLGALSNILGGLSLAIAVFVSSFYLSLSRDGVERFIKAVTPDSFENTALLIYERSRRQIGLWFRTQIFLSVVVGVLVWISLALLGVPHAFLLGVLAGIFEIVPYIGPIAAGAAAVLSALSSSAGLALSALIVVLVIQQFESHILIPLVVRRSVGLHPVIVIISLLIGVQVAGFLGLLISVPAAAVLQEVIEYWSSKKLSRRPAS